MKSLILSRLALILLVACEPVKESESDKNALYDTSNVSAEGWKIEGKSAKKIDGLALWAAPRATGSAFSDHTLQLDSTSMTRSFPSLKGLSEGTARVNFRLVSFPPSGFRILMSFATGVGLPVAVQITNTGITAKCGSFFNDAVVPTESKDLALNDAGEHSLRLVRESGEAHVVFDDVVIIQNLLCPPVADPGQAARAGGELAFTVFSNAPEGGQPQLVEEFNNSLTEILLSRISVYKDVVMND